MIKKLFLCMLLALQAKILAYSSFDTAYELNCESLVWQDEDWPNESYGDYLERSLKYQLEPQVAKKRRAVFKLFQELTKTEKQPHNVLFDSTTAQELNLFCGQKIGERYFAQIIDRTKTEVGKVFLYGLLSNPTDNLQELERRQSLIAYFIEHAELLNSVDGLYEQLKKTESIALSFIGHDVFLQSSRRHYFPIPFLKKFLNKSEIALGIRSVIGHQERITGAAMAMAAAVILPLWGFSQGLRKNQQFFPESLTGTAQRLVGSGGRGLGLLSGVENKWIAGTAIITAGAFCALNVKKEIEWIRDNIILDRCLQHKMMLMAQFFRAVESLKEILTEHPALLARFPAAGKTIDFFEKVVVDTPELERLLGLLQSRTFDGEASLWSHQGRVLVAYKLMHQVKNSLKPLLASIGEIDAYCSLARLYKEHKEDRVHFCFTQFLQDQTPHIEMNGFWNPFIESKKVITNDLKLGDDHSNMVITGPNAGGKSTVIKSVVLNLILSQSVGLAAADLCKISLFHTIATYLQVVDNIAAGNSLFKAQVLRAQQIVKLVETTPQHKFTFVALDEMFNGTSAQESKVAAYSVAKHIGKYRATVCLLATHFPLLTKLADEDAGFGNYKVSVIVDGSSIYYPYRLEHGISDQHIALDILRNQGFAYSIVDEALELLKKDTST